MKARGKRTRFGTLVFLIPILLVAALVAFAVIDTTNLQKGTLIVRAQTSARYYPALALDVPVSISGKAGTTPFNLTLSAGTYTVDFPAQRWFVAPHPRTVNLTAGGTSYVVGTYSPIPVFVSVDQNHFNTTSVEVLRAITPVIWVNPSSNYEVISSSLTGSLFIPPLQNYTYVFRGQGTFTFSFVGVTSHELVVTVI